jgi:DNA-binding response OmpR family regulator
MPKIFSTEELIARINAVIRRKNNIKDLKLKYKNIKFDLNSKSIMI